ncbi:hypothetical protein [Poseidonocella sp. HB161398]|uniref:hypothetical protein n=1 Tax=Poseidonocella sp. HB161398 TaxID=2320855 RepID=UPI001109E54B|nr:hypothetical protein [Poseidonocella sp. HB161398]
MTLRFRFSNSDMITTAGVAMRPLEIDDKGGTFERVGQPGITEAFSHQELAEMMRRPDTTYFAGYFDRTTQEAHRDKPVQVISELSEETARLVIWRKAVCDAFLALEAAGLIKRTQRAYEQAKAQLASVTERLVGEGAAAFAKIRPGQEIKIRSCRGAGRSCSGSARIRPQATPHFRSFRPHTDPAIGPGAGARRQKP